MNVRVISVINCGVIFAEGEQNFDGYNWFAYWAPHRFEALCTRRHS